MRRPSLQEIYNSIPDLKLPCENCGRCCGNILLTRLEMQNIMQYCETNKLQFSHPVVFVPAKGDYVTFNIKLTKHCPLLIDNKCSIYAVRPFICRLYGHAKGLSCKEKQAKDYTFTESQANRLCRLAREAWH